jgi:hypothetical protein
MTCCPYASWRARQRAGLRGRPERVERPLRLKIVAEMTHEVSRPPERAYAAIFIDALTPGLRCRQRHPRLRVTAPAPRYVNNLAASASTTVAL